jgi:predicted nucleotidyltransferase
VFTPEDRERVRARLLELARDDDRVTGAAITGSAAEGGEDRWSDVDVFLGIAEGIDPGGVMADWTARLTEELDAVDHWDLPVGPAIYRVFLFSSCLQVDVAFTPESEFGARGPAFRVEFGTPVERAEESAPPSIDWLAGLGWLYLLHARVAIERDRAWQATNAIDGLRDQTLGLACVRHGERPEHARGAHRLPRDVTAPLEATLVRSLDPEELRRALRAATEAFLAEVRESSPDLASRLEPVLREAGGA